MNDSAPSPIEPQFTLQKILEILLTHQVPYYLVGSFASGYRGEFRATNDIDIVADFSSCSLGNIITLLHERQFYADELQIPRHVAAARSFNIVDEETLIKVDFFPPASTLEKDQFQRATSLPVPDSDMAVIVSTTEYNIIAKLRWYRKSNEVLERQLKDVQSLIRMNKASLDRDYLETWARTEGIADLLSQVMKSVD